MRKRRLEVNNRLQSFGVDDDCGVSRCVALTIDDIADKTDIDMFRAAENRCVHHVEDQAVSHPRS